LEWSEAEQVILDLLRKQVDTVATLEVLMAAAVGSDDTRPRLVAELRLQAGCGQVRCCIAHR